MVYSASNAKLEVNGNEILASNASLSVSANLEATYLINQRHTQDYAAVNGVGGQLSFNYYITGRDYFKKFITGQGEIPLAESQVISGNFGGLNFDSGYLTSYSVNFAPNSPAIANATVVFYDQLNGVFTATEEAAPSSTQILNLRDAVLSSTFTTGIVNEFIGGTYNYSSDVQPVYLMNETKPSSVSFGPKTVRANFEIDNPTGHMPVSGSMAKISLDLKNDSNTIVENFTCSGLLQQRSLGSANQDYIKHSINIMQNNIQASEVRIEAIVNMAGQTGNIGIGTAGSEGNI